MEQISNYVAPLEIGDVMRCGGIARVLESKSKKFKKGDIVSGQTCWQTHPILDAAELEKVDDESMATKYLGALGSTGLTAYFGVTKISKPKPGDTVVITGAAGGVGSVAGQIFKIAGCKVIGIAGGKEKCEVLTNEVGVDGTIDYKSEDIDKKIKEFAPEGIDIFFDNVGGEILDFALDNLRDRARVVICGAISQYSHDKVDGPSLYLRLAEKYARMEGFTVMHFEEHYEKASKELLDLHNQGKLKVPFHIEEGIDNFPLALQKLFTGGNTGKLMVKV